MKYFRKGTGLFIALIPLIVLSVLMAIYFGWLQMLVIYALVVGAIALMVVGTYLFSSQ